MKTVGAANFELRGLEEQITIIREACYVRSVLHVDETRRARAYYLSATSIPRVGVQQRTSNLLDPMPQTSDTIGRYRLGDLIAVGGMGSVHRGLLTGAAEFSRIVAIKRMHPELAEDPLFKAHFLEEARLNARVVHPNVVQLLDVVESDGELWLIMEHVDGDTLQALQSAVLAAGRKLPLNVIVGVMAAVLEGLHVAHEATDAIGRHLGIVHRDVSPQNIMISRLGQVKVIDFGVATATTRAGSRIASRLVGKFSYMSPEQACGGPLDQRSDTFAAGVVLWEALTGRRLFRTANQSQEAILRDIAQKPVPIPSSFRAEIPAELDAVVLRALERNKSERFASGREFARALEAIVPPAAPSEIGAYLTVFCEVRAASPAPPPLDAPTISLQNSKLRSNLEHDEVTALASPGHAKLAHMRELAKRPLRLAEGMRWTGPRTGPALALACISLVALLISQLGSAVLTSRSGDSAPIPAARTLLTDEGRSSPHEARIMQPAAAGSFQSATTTSFQETPAVTATAPPVRVRPVPRLASQSSRAPRALAAVPLDCSTPTYLGDDGIRHFKEKCL